MSVDQNKSILVIDDDITIRKLISHHLNLYNYKVYLASNTDQGFDLLHNNKIDLVLCDVTMDKMDGFTFCRIVREDKNYRSLPFVFVTAKNTFEDKSRALEVGGDDFITKPFSVEELILKVKALIRKSEIYLIYGTRKSLEESFSKKQSRIVLIDDDEGLVKLLQFNLNKVGIDCRVAYNAKEGYKIVESFIPDLIIADIVMPGVDGFEFREMLLKNPDLSSIPFVFLSHRGSEKDILEGYKRDITAFRIGAGSVVLDWIAEKTRDCSRIRMFQLLLSGMLPLNTATRFCSGITISHCPGKSQFNNPAGSRNH